MKSFKKTFIASFVLSGVANINFCNETTEKNQPSLIPEKTQLSLTSRLLNGVIGAATSGAIPFVVCHFLKGDSATHCSIEAMPSALAGGLVTLFANTPNEGTIAILGASLPFALHQALTEKKQKSKPTEPTEPTEDYTNAKKSSRNKPGY